MWHDYSDSNEPVVRECATSDSARTRVVPERLVLRIDGVFAGSVGIPGWRVPGPAAPDKFGAMSLVEDFDALGPVDLTDAR